MHLYIRLSLRLILVIETKSFALDWIVPFEAGQLFVQFRRGVSVGGQSGRPLVGSGSTLHSYRAFVY